MNPEEKKKDLVTGSPNAQFAAAVEARSMLVYKCQMGSGSHFQQGVDFAVKYLKEHPGLLERMHSVVD